MQAYAFPRTSGARNPIVIVKIFGGPSPRGRGNAFPRTSGAKNPIVIVKIFIFIFLRLKVMLQAKPFKGGWCNLEKTTYICLQGTL